jgi:hypothetical protein
MIILILVIMMQNNPPSLKRSGSDKRKVNIHTSLYPLQCKCGYIIHLRLILHDCEIDDALYQLFLSYSSYNLCYADTDVPVTSCPQCERAFPKILRVKEGIRSDE